MIGWIVSAIALVLSFSEVAFPWCLLSALVAWLYAIHCQNINRQISFPDRDLKRGLSYFITLFVVKIAGAAICVLVITMIPGDFPYALMGLASLYGFFTGLHDRPSAIRGFPGEEKAAVGDLEERD